MSNFSDEIAGLTLCVETSHTLIITYLSESCNVKPYTLSRQFSDDSTPYSDTIMLLSCVIAGLAE